MKNQNKIRSKLIMGLSLGIWSLLAVSCGSYVPVSYDNDGIYGSGTTPDNTPVAIQNTQNQSTPQAATVKPGVFSEQLNDYSLIGPQEGEVFTDVENYSSQNYDPNAPETEGAAYQTRPSWNNSYDDAQTNVVINSGFGFNNYYPFWNRGFRNNFGFFGYNNFYNPYYFGPFYGNGFYGGFNNGFVGGFYGGFYSPFYINRGFNNVYYGNRFSTRRSVGSFTSRRSTANTSARRTFVPRSARTSSSNRSFSARSSSSNNRSARVGSSSSSSRSSAVRRSSSGTSSSRSSSARRTYTPRSNSSSSYRRSYTPRSSSSGRSFSPRSSGRTFRRR